VKEIKRSSVVIEALDWLDTPWHHHQCCKGFGVDCVQLLYGIGRSVGFIPSDYVIENYEPLARGSFLVRHLDKWLNEAEQIKPGSVLLFHVGGLLTHVGIAIDEYEYIHASHVDGRVVISPIGDFQRSNLRKIYDIPGVLDG
jgi:cell wall-associated NlpC family hydrolase